MHKMSRQPVDGINYITFSFCENPAKQMEIIKHLELREDDVIGLGFPRSGNHWAFEVTNMVLRGSLKLMDTFLHKSLLENAGDSVAETLEKSPSPRYLTTHLRVHRLPVQAVEKNVRVIYIIRNPKDVLVSLYKFMSCFKDQRNRFEGTWDQFFELHMAGEFMWGTWFDHVIAMDTFMKEHPNQPVYVRSFEKAKTEPIVAIEELCSFLGKPQSIAEQIAEVSEFKSMKKMLNNGKFNLVSPFKGNTTDTVLSKGEIGSWKEFFTVSQSEHFNEVFSEKMADCKLADYVIDYL